MGELLVEITYNMKAFIALFALVAAVNADAEAEADPYYAYGAYGGYAGFAGLAGYHGAYAGLPYGAYGYAHPAVGTVAVGHVAAVKAVEHTPAEVAVKAIEGTVPVAVAAPAALTYHHAGLGYAGLGAYGAYGLGAYGLAGHHVIGKREAEADADPAYFYNGYHGYAGYGYAGLGAYGAYGLGAYGLGAYGAYGAYPYAAAYTGLAGLALKPSDPTNPTAVHTSRLGVCVNYLGAQVPC